MQIDADEDMEHVEHVFNHCHCGCRELQVFQSNTYAGEHPMCIQVEIIWKCGLCTPGNIIVLHVYEFV